MIVCTDINGGIGDLDGNLLFKLPKDLKHFKSVTSGKTVVMGRKTWDSLPNKPLQKRKNYVLSNDLTFQPEGAKLIRSIQDVVEMSKSRDVFVIGGQSIYEQLIDYADKLIVTHVHTASENAHTFFPEFNHKQWKIVSSHRHEADEQHSHSFTFAEYVRKSEMK